LTQLPAAYDADDIFPSVRQGLSVNNTLYALPFYGESTVTYYRTDL
ncbi:MAG TPA: sugar ABC transporter substrate-binding protein, partial [Pseudomonas sp.]|nr:sugar ABC transporter substrate-binding protein [Pseudomonas sp.]